MVNVVSAESSQNLPTINYNINQTISSMHEIFAQQITEMYKLKL